jgi:hypothetical protein
MKFWLFFFVGLLTLTSCQASLLTGRTRVLMVVDGSNLTISAIVEGSNGMSLNGAAVGVTDPGGAWQPIAFNTSQNAYVLRSAALNGVYRLEVTSVLPVANAVIEIPAVVFTGSPEVSQVIDSLGNVAQEFKRLSAATPIRVVWQAVPEASRYLLEVRQNGKTVFSQTLVDTSLVLPAMVLEGSSSGLNASVSIVASFSSGDSKFLNSPFFSASSRAASTFTFQVVP